MTKLNASSILITGASSGIGAALAIACAGHSLTVLTPQAARTRYPDVLYDPSLGPQFVAVVLTTAATPPAAAIAGGLIVDWRPA